MLSKLRAIPGTVRSKLPGGSADDREGTEDERAQPPGAPRPDPDTEAVAEGIADEPSATTGAASTDEPDETRRAPTEGEGRAPDTTPPTAHATAEADEDSSLGEKLVTGATYLTIGGFALGSVGLIVLLALRKLRPKSPAQELMDEVPNRRRDIPTGVAREYDGPKHAPAVGIVALVLVRAFVDRLGGEPTEPVHEDE